jgi:hypothetical protein
MWDASQSASNEALWGVPMSTEADLEVRSAERIDGTEVIVEFSDGTYAIYLARELAELKPDRQRVSPGISGRGMNGESNGPDLP